MSAQDPRPGTRQLFGVWARIGLQSFGGGASTTLLIQQAFIEQKQWLSMEEFLRLWNLCLLTPGINLVAVTVLIGKKVGGTWGIIASLAGMLLPSAIITCLLAALFVQIEQSAMVQAVLRGIIPATGGIMLLVGLNFARPLLAHARKAGFRALLVSGALIVASALVILLWQVSVFVIILGAACVGAAFFSPRRVALPQATQESSHD
jgi:chromate transporter